MEIEPAQPCCLSSESSHFIYVKHSRLGTFAGDPTPLVPFPFGWHVHIVPVEGRIVSVRLFFCVLYIVYCKSPHFASLSSQIPVYTTKKCPII
jgi:hypothetical protein